MLIRKPSVNVIRVASAIVIWAIAVCPRSVIPAASAAVAVELECGAQIRIHRPSDGEDATQVGKCSRCNVRVGVL